MEGGGRGGFRCFSRNMRRHGMDLFDGIFLQKPKMAFRKTPVSKIDAANWTGSDFFFVHWPIFWAIIPLHKRALKFPFPPLFFTQVTSTGGGEGRKERNLQWKTAASMAGGKKGEVKGWGGRRGRKKFFSFDEKEQKRGEKRAGDSPTFFVPDMLRPIAQKLCFQRQKSIRKENHTAVCVFTCRFRKKQVFSQKKKTSAPLFLFPPKRQCAGCVKVRGIEKKDEKCAE